MFELADRLELLWLDHGAVHVHHHDPKIPIRQVEGIANGFLNPSTIT
jgi:hypothetical protein